MPSALLTLSMTSQVAADTAGVANPIARSKPPKDKDDDANANAAGEESIDDLDNMGRTPFTQVRVPLGRLHQNTYFFA